MFGKKDAIIKNKRQQLKNEIMKNSESLLLFALQKVEILNEAELDADGYCGFDYLHDAVHTLRGRLPKGGAELKSMRESWVSQEDQ